MVAGIEVERGGIQGGVSRSTRNRGGVAVDGEAAVVPRQPQVHCQVHPALLRAGTFGRPQRDPVLRARADVLLSNSAQG